MILSSRSSPWVKLAFTLLSSVMSALAAPGSPQASSTSVPKVSGPIHSMSTGLGTYARANFLADGSILGTFTHFSGGNTIIQVTSSTDSGDTWALKGTLGTKPSASSFFQLAYPLQLSNGRIVAAYCDHDRNGTNDWSMFRINMSYSDDKGVTWRFLSSAVTHPGPTHHGLWEPFLRRARDGSLQLYYSYEPDANNQVNLMRRSTDGGKTWSDPPVTVSSKANEHDGMSGVTMIDGNNLIAVFETSHPGSLSVNSVTSSDDGATWGNRRKVYETNAGHLAGAPQVVNIGGTLVASFMTNECTVNVTGGWPNGARVKLLTSTDRGATWSNKMYVADGQSNWPALLKLDNSSFLGLYDRSGPKAQKIELTPGGVPQDCAQVQKTARMSKEEEMVAAHRL